MTTPDPGRVIPPPVVTAHPHRLHRLSWAEVWAAFRAEADARGIDHITNHVPPSGHWTPTGTRAHVSTGDFMTEAETATPLTPGQINYEAYAEVRRETGPSPVDWSELGSVRQAAWEAGAAAVLAQAAEPATGTGDDGQHR